MSRRLQIHLSFGISNKHFRYWMLMAAICSLVIVRNVLGVKFPVAIFLLMGLMLCLLSTREEIVAFICSMAAFEMTFQYRYMLLIAAACLLLKSNRLNFKGMLPTFFMMVWELLHFMGQSFQFSLVFLFIREFIVLITLGVVLMEEPIDYSDGLPMRSLAWMTLFSSIVTAFVSGTLTGYSLTSGARLGSTYDLSEAFNALLNPNIGGFLCVLSICGLVLLWSTNNKKRMDMPVIAALSLFTLLYQSKSSIICLPFAFLVYFYAKYRNWIVSTFKVLGVALMATIIGFIFFENAIEGFLSRFMVADISTGRISVFKFYHGFLMSDLKNLFFGMGMHDYLINRTQLFPSDMLVVSHAATYIRGQMVLVVSHNNIQEIAVIWGIPGIALMSWLLFEIVKHKKMTRNIMHYLAFIYILMYTLQSQLLSGNVSMIGLIFALVCLEYRSEDISNLQLRKASH